MIKSQHCNNQASSQNSINRSLWHLIRTDFRRITYRLPNIYPRPRGAGGAASTNPTEKACLQFSSDTQRVVVLFGDTLGDNNQPSFAPRWRRAKKSPRDLNWIIYVLHPHSGLAPAQTHTHNNNIGCVCGCGVRIWMHTNSGQEVVALSCARARQEGIGLQPPSSTFGFMAAWCSRASWLIAVPRSGAMRGPWTVARGFARPGVRTCGISRVELALARRFIYDTLEVTIRIKRMCSFGWQSTVCCNNYIRTRVMWGLRVRGWVRVEWQCCRQHSNNYGWARLRRGHRMCTWNGMLALGSW